MTVLPCDVREARLRDLQPEPATPEAALSHFLVILFCESAELKARLFLFGFLQQRVTFTTEDFFFWSVASATVVPLFFLSLLHAGL